MTEKILHKTVCDYLRLQYNDVLFNSDLSDATKLTMGQAAQMKNLRSNRGFPDIVIYKPNNGYHGLFLELKVAGTRLYKKNGDPATPHIEEQLYCLLKLKTLGYENAFAVGFDQAKLIIDTYLSQKPGIMFTQDTLQRIK